MPNGMMPAAKPQFDLTQAVQSGWDNANQQHTKLTQQNKRLAAVRTQLDSLVKLGDTITVEDVVKGAGALVGAGFEPAALAQMLSQMPTVGGQALQAWVAQQDQMVRAGEAQMQKTLKASAVHRGLNAFAMLHLKHVKQQQGIGGPPSGGSGIPMPAPALGKTPAQSDAEGGAEGED